MCSLAGTEPLGVSLPPDSRPSVSEQLVDRYARVRGMTEALCEPLEIEDYVIQSMPDASPTKWHLAHTTWFFETFVLKPRGVDDRPADPRFGYLFNSYYNSVGPQWTRSRRGVLARPTVREVFAYRHQVDRCMTEWLAGRDMEHDAALRQLVLLGLNHEQQHQELMLTDIKHLFACNPLRPVYRPERGSPDRADRAPVPGIARGTPAPQAWVGCEGGVHAIGQAGDGFAYDNEGPRHEVLLRPFDIASWLVTNAEYLAFIEDGGYLRPELWLSDGWNVVQSERWNAPLYWEQVDGAWHVMTLSGFRKVDPHEPVVHVSCYEADAYARWAGARLPTEQEWEVTAAPCPIEGCFVESRRFHPAPARARGPSAPRHPDQMFGDAWEWTASPYMPYPGYRPADGALGEYNGKFMCNQVVLRGGSCATSATHLRVTYRNFFPPAARWQFSGIRLARDAT